MNILKTTIASSSLVFMLSAGASQALAAGDSLQTMFKGWAGESSQLVTSKMTYSTVGARYDPQRAIQIYSVTVDAEGEIQDYEMITRQGKRRLSRASDRLLDRLDSFPKLPRGYQFDELTFVLVLDYDASPYMTRTVWKKYNATRTGIYDVTGKRLPDEIVMLGAGR